jgi:general secretion pathway protein D
MPAGDGGQLVELSDEEPAKAADSEPQYAPGTGNFLNLKKRKPSVSQKREGKITLNFENTDIREVVKVILGDTLKMGYIMDPGVQGTATLQTGSPLSNDDLLPTMEMLLRMNGAAMVQTDGVYHIVPISNAVRGNLTPQLGESAQPLPFGFSVRVVPLRYISAEEMSKILTPFTTDGGIVRVDKLRNLLVLAGTGMEMSHLLDTIRLFDVDWIKGLSVGFFSLKYAKAESIINKLNTLFGDDTDGALSGLLRMVPIDDANGLLVVTPQKEYLETVSVWISRLDQVDASEDGEQQLFVYRVKNSDAGKLADLLSQLFGDQAPSRVKKPSVAPGKTPVTLASSKETGKKEAETKRSPTRSNLRLSSGGGGGGSVRIVADTDRNSLLITASPRQYSKIIDALDELDTIPLQVLVEATIIEVSLEGDLEYGLQWFFRERHGSYTGEGLLTNVIDATLPATVSPGFNFSLLKGTGDINVVLSALAEDSLVRVLSSPSVMVLDNHTARIQVGDQVAVTTKKQQSTTGGSGSPSNIINEIEYRDTGVVLEVTPRVNPGGLVIMDVSQEVSDAIEGAAVDTPTIQTRKITSAIAVQNGEAIILGGLIKDKDEDGNTGVPVLKDVPVFGWLFGKEAKISDRTELVVVLTPRVIKDAKDSRTVVEDFRNRLEGLKGAF